VSVLSDDLRTLSYEAALYFYPLVFMDITRLQALNTPAGSKPGVGPPDQFQHFGHFRALISAPSCDPISTPCIRRPA
jgi:hypothetical protein